MTSAPLPDLAPVSFTLQQSTVDAGQPILFEERVLNQGVADAASLFQAGLYLSTDVDIDPADDVFLGSRAVLGLAAGQVSDSGPQSLVIPGIAAGSYFVGLVVDAGDFVPEAAEDNNVLIASSALSVTVPPMPDLRADSFEFDRGLVADGTGIMTISRDFSNAGSASSAAVQATVYLSSDNAVTTADIAVGAIQVEALAPGSGVGRTVDLPLPGGIASGS